MKVLVFCPNWVGDAVMATPTLRALRRRFPAATIVGLARPGVADTLAGAPWLNGFILHDHRSSEPERRTWGVIGQVRSQQFDLAVLLTNSIRSALIAWLGGVRRRVGYAREGRRILLNDPLPIKKGRRGYVPSPVIDYYLALAHHLGAEREPYPLELFTSKDDEAQADATLKRLGIVAGERYAVLNPGAAFGPAKRWPSAYFSDLARRLVDRHGLKVVVLCGPEERGLSRFIADGSMRPRHVKSLADETLSIGLSKAITRRAALMVTTDSGPRHFAAAFQVPVVSLFGPTHIAWTDTYFPAEEKLQIPLECGPCQQRQCPLGHHRCMNELTVDLVHAAVERRLEDEKRKVRSA